MNNHRTSGKNDRMLPLRLAPLQDRWAEGILHDNESRLPGRPPMREQDIVELLRSAL